jgi:hypothetical protein
MDNSKSEGGNEREEIHIQVKDFIKNAYTIQKASSRKT